MPKNIEDIVSAPDESPRSIHIARGKRSIRDVPVPERRRPINLIDGVAPKGPGGIERRHLRPEDVPIPRVKVPMHRDFVTEAPVAVHVRSRTSETPKRSFRKGTWLGAGLALLVLLFAILSLFEGATLAYTPSSLPLSFNNDTFTAEKSGSGELLYSVVKLSGKKGRTVPASGEETVSEKATGFIVVYNETSSAQKLVKNTRFETADGKVYRVQSDITVPGKTGETPGSLEITVLADQPGEVGNIGLSDFTLPGLKGDPKYATIYARSKSPMAGGFTGVRKKVSVEDSQVALTELEQELKEELIKEAQAQVPEDFILYPGLTTFTTAVLPQTEADASTAMVNLEGNLEGAMFRIDDLERFFAEEKISPDFANADIPELRNLTVGFVGTAPNLQSANAVTFQVNGSATLVLKTDEVALKSDLRGVEKANLEAILTKYPSIETADAVIRPFWKSSFPESIEDITLKQTSL